VGKGQKNIKVRLGLAVRDLRLRRNLTQEELAHRARLHRTYLTEIERGTRNPSIEVVEKLANGLAISLSELFRFAETATLSPKLVSKRKRVS
jgi:transcriptional regulator with XRE-family HTH domain